VGFQPPKVRYLPDLAMEEGEDHEAYIAEVLASRTDGDAERIVLEILDPQLEVTAADRAVLWDTRVLERVYAALSRIAAEISQGARSPVPKGIRPQDMPILRGRIAAERRPMGKVLKQLQTAEDGEKIRLNAQAHRLAGKIHHHTVAAARAMLRKGMTEDQILMSLRDQYGIPRTDGPAAELQDAR